jgi:hypothetical protein
MNDEVNIEEQLQFSMTEFMSEQWLNYILIYVFLIYIYNKVFRARKLPVLKSLIVYAVIAVGAFVLLIFQIDAGLPILQSLSIAVAMMLIVRIRYFFVERAQKKSKREDERL